MSVPHPVYRTLVRFYPGEFRRGYIDDLAQEFDDLIADRSIRTAWGRTALDLAVTIPRYRLEIIMNEHQSTTITLIFGLIAAAGVASVLTGFYPGALLLAVAQRSTFARAPRANDADCKPLPCWPWRSSCPLSPTSC